jgi:hypothetical protein
MFKKLNRCRRAAVLVGLYVASALGCAAEPRDLVSDPAPSVGVDASGPIVTGFSGPGSGGMDGGVGIVATRDGGAFDAAVSSFDASRPMLPAGDEVCDGIDNDGNGTIDDVDVKHDGICDCLRIATMGIPGGSGKGNIFGSWLNSRSDVPAVALAGTVLTPELLRPFQVIVVQNLNPLKRTYSDAEIEALEQWVRAGGGLMTTIGYASPSERTNTNNILARFGIAYGDQQILIRDTENSVPVTEWFGPHPVTQGVSRVGVDNGYAVLGQGTTLAREQGNDLLKVQEVGTGHVVVWGDEWITYDSEWASRADYQVEQFWVNVIKWLTVEKVCQVPPVIVQ